jgi:hypothetical protein
VNKTSDNLKLFTVAQEKRSNHHIWGHLTHFGSLKKFGWRFGAWLEIWAFGWRSPAIWLEVATLDYRDSEFRLVDFLPSVL